MNQTPKKPLNQPNKVLVAYDIDGVLLNFIEMLLTVARFRFLGECNHWPQRVQDWNCWLPKQCAPEFGRVFALINEYPESYWGTLKAHYNDVAPEDITPDFYLSTFSFPRWIRDRNLQELGFPNAPIIQCSSHEEKVHMIQHYGITHVIEDRHKNWMRINRETEAECYLINRPWNESVWAEYEDPDSVEDWYYDTALTRLSQFERIINIERQTQ